MRNILHQPYRLVTQNHKELYQITKPYYLKTFKRKLKLIVCVNSRENNGNLKITFHTTSNKMVGMKPSPTQSILEGAFTATGLKKHFPENISFWISSLLVFCFAIILKPLRCYIAQLETRFVFVFCCIRDFPKFAGNWSPLVRLYDSLCRDGRCIYLIPPYVWFLN